MDRLMSTPFMQRVSGENDSPLENAEMISRYYKEFALEVVNLCGKKEAVPAYFTLIYTRLELNEVFNSRKCSESKKK